MISLFCNKCGSEIRIFEIDIVKAENAQETINVYSSCSNNLCEVASDIHVQKVVPKDTIFDGKYTNYVSKDEVLAKWNIYTCKKRDAALKTLEGLLLQHCKDVKYESEQ